jgi:hypothetical protein
MGGIRARLGGSLIAAVVSLAVAPGVVQADTAPGSNETLALAASGQRGVGKELKITVEGIADGAHRLFVFGQSEGCPGWLGRYEQAPAEELTAPGGETLPSGPFSRSFEVIPERGTVYGVCAFLDTSSSALPDAWTSGCFSLDGTPDCRFPELDPYGVLAAEEMGRKVVAEEERELTERETREREARERLAAEAVARGEREHEEAKVHEAARCHVPRLVGHSQAGAKRLLLAAHCRLGHVTVRQGAGKPVHVVWQRPRRGGSYAPGTSVAVRLD